MGKSEDTQLNEKAQLNLIDNIPKETLFRLLDNPHESLIILDEQGYILFMSHSYERLASISAAEAIGQHITTVLPDSELMRVVETGKPEFGKPFVVNGKKRIISRIPLKNDGKLIGVYGKILFWHTGKIKELYQELDRLQGEVFHYKEELNQLNSNRYNLANIIGESELLNIAKSMARQTAETDSTVLITGESGTGKEIFAHAIHNMSKRSSHSFVRINCSCIPYELAESELFGYAPGAFTGANPKGKIGKFEMAEKGTIFLDEIGDMHLNLQAKLLRVLEEMEIEKIGGKTQKVDCRIIAATNRNLEEMIKKGEFRLDLYYRLNVVNIKLPPLRNIITDLPQLVRHFIDKYKLVFSKNIKSISNETMKLLMCYSWPGNMRELANVMESAFICCNVNQIESQHLPSRIITSTEPPLVNEDNSLSFKEQMHKAEKKILTRTLKMTGNNKALASKLLGIHRTGLYQKVKKYKIDTQ